MYLVSLKLQEGIGDQQIIRNVKFNKKGLNIVVDETKNGKGNNVGKTTFLRIIDLCLGASEKKYLWTDYDSGSQNNVLKDYINLNKVFAELVISIDKVNYTLRRDLFERGTQYINGEKVNSRKYDEKLNEIIFHHSAPPTFRQLIKKFVRIKQKDDSYGTLKYLHTNTTNVEYTNIYEFLFKLSDPDTSSKRLEYSNAIKEHEDLRENLLKAHSIENLEELHERSRLISNEIESLEKELDKYISLTQYKNEINKITNIKNYINEKNDLLNSLQFKKNKMLEIIKSENNREQNIDFSLLEDFYKEVKQSIEGVKVKFEELIKFNEQIKANRINYYTAQISQLEEKISETIKFRNKLIEDNSDILNLLNDDNFAKFKSIHEKLLKNKESLGELNEINTVYQKVSNDLACYTKKLESLGDDIKYTDSMKMFNDYLSKLSQKVIGQRLFLIPSDGFPLKLSNIDDGVGTGHRKTITLLLDIAYVHLINKLQLNYPSFFVHDVLESIDEHNMKNIVNAIEEVHAQFIFAILKEKIDNYDFIDEKDIILQLSEDNKLFKV